MAAWDRRIDEGPVEYSYFCAFRDMGPTRKIEAVARQFEKSPGYLYSLSSEFVWIERADQWDAHVRAVHDRAYLDQTMRAGRQRAAVAIALMGKVSRALAQFSDEKLAKASLYELAQVARIASELQRLEEGLATGHYSLEVNDVRTILALAPTGIRERLVSLLAGQAGEPVSGAAAGSPLALPEVDETGE